VVRPREGKETEGKNKTEKERARTTNFIGLDRLDVS